MAKSKRSKVVALTKVKKKGREWKDALFEKVRTLCDKYENVYVFKHKNMRNDRFKELREELRESSAFMLASTKKLHAALGREQEDEYRLHAHKLTEYLHGQSGLFFTNLTHEKVQSLFVDFHHEDFARAGGKATRTVTLPSGPLFNSTGTPFPHTMEHSLRAHGLPTSLNKGVIELRCDHTVCEEGKVLTSNQAAILRHLDVKMAVFRLKLVACVRGNEQDKAEFEILDNEESDEDDAPELTEFDDGLPASMMMPSIA